MYFFLVFLLILNFLEHNAIAQPFEKAIQKDSFNIKTSQEDLKSLHNTSTLVVGCVDFRLRDEITKFLQNKLHLLDDYDEISLPGAGLAFVEKKYPHWGKTIEDVIDILKELHQIKRVIFIDHLGCGAYKLLKGEKVMKTTDIERSAHQEVFKEVRNKMKEKFPDLEVYTFIMDLDGAVEQIKP